jgi:hypothetical protein
MNGSRFRLLHALQDSVMPFVQPPVGYGAHPRLIKGIQAMPGSPDRSTQYAGEAHVKPQMQCLEVLSGLPGLRDSRLCEGDVVPSTKAPALIRNGATMPKQHQRR